MKSRVKSLWKNKKETENRQAPHSAWSISGILCGPDWLMHLISREAGGCIMVRLRVFVSPHLSWMAAAPNPLKDVDAYSETLRSVLFKHCLETRGVICLNPPAKRPPDTADATAWWITINLKTNDELKVSNLWSGVHTAGQISCKKRNAVGVQSKQNHISDSWYLQTSLLKELAHTMGFCIGNAHSSAWWHLWHCGVTLHQLLDNLLQTDLNFWLGESWVTDVFVWLD